MPGRYNVDESREPSAKFFGASSYAIAELLCTDMRTDVDMAIRRACDTHQRKALVEAVKRSTSMSLQGRWACRRRRRCSRYNVDESREPNAKFFGASSYAVTKRASEHLLAYSASISGGRWSALVANPGILVMAY